MSFTDPLARVQELIDLFQILNPDTQITSEFRVRGTTLQKLGQTGSGGYQRVVKWAREKVAKLQSEATPASDADKLKLVYKHCFELMKGRNDKYGDSWRVLTIPGIANLIEMKMHRIANMNAQDLDPKIIDEFIDSLNYAAMGLQKLKELGHSYD